MLLQHICDDFKQLVVVVIRDEPTRGVYCQYATHRI